MQFAYKILSLTLFLCYFHGCLLAIVFCRENFIKKQPLMAFDTPFEAKNANIVVSAQTFLITDFRIQNPFPNLVSMLLSWLPARHCVLSWKFHQKTTSNGFWHSIRHQTSKKRQYCGVRSDFSMQFAYKNPFPNLVSMLLSWLPAPFCFVVKISSKNNL